MHRLVLSGVAALTLLALVTGGRGEVAAFNQAEAARTTCPNRTAIADAPWGLDMQLAVATRSNIQAHRVLVADNGLGQPDPKPTMAAVAKPRHSC